MKVDINTVIEIATWAESNGKSPSDALSKIADKTVEWDSDLKELKLICKLTPSERAYQDVLLKVTEAAETTKIGEAAFKELASAATTVAEQAKLKKNFGIQNSQLYASSPKLFSRAYDEVLKGITAQEQITPAAVMRKRDVMPHLRDWCNKQNILLTDD